MPASLRPGSLDALRIDDSYLRELPGDLETGNTPRQVYGACWSRVKPSPVTKPSLLAHSREVAALLGLDDEACHEPHFAEIFGGNALLPGMRPYAACYGGHQFGHWAGQLGDGRAIVLGEVLNASNERWTLQLKGAGLTPYSRTADGRAVLRSSVREFLCSEAMHHLGIPTTRALSLVGTGEGVVRDMFYNGNPQLEPGAVVCRVAPSFTRFGNFEIFTARDDLHTLRKLADYTIRTDFPELLAESKTPDRETYLAWFREIARRTAHLIVHWMRVGFVHGVMNTDNMSILGLTIDYGPYGWLEGFDPLWTPNTTDAQGRRYSFGNQPHIARWNLVRLAQALMPLVGDIEAMKEVLHAYPAEYDRAYDAMMAAKLGLRAHAGEEDDALIDALWGMLSLTETDYTLFFRALADLTDDPATDDDALLEVIAPAWYLPDQVNPEIRRRTAAWLRLYLARRARDGRNHDGRRAVMNTVNPKYVPRNYLAQIAIDKAEAGDPSMIHELLEVFRHPYDEQPEHERYAAKRPEWARQRAGCSMLSCSS
ncbi:MAG: protein adenylyltransferase SelO [Pseudomonadota bacterium]